MYKYQEEITEENDGADMEGKTGNSKDRVSQLIVKQIKKRSKIAYGLWDAFKHNFMGCCCRSP